MAIVIGMRISVLACSGLILVGSGIRCITSIPKYATWWVNICTCINTFNLVDIYI
jgi:hypothetical protein